jgi:two-component system sensor histidine kinase HydH
VLLPIVAAFTLSNIHREKEMTTRMLLEKGAALIRSFEAGTRTGMMGRGGFQLQRLLTETAQQPDIAYLMVVDTAGRVLAHSDLQRIGTVYDPDLAYGAIAENSALQWRQLSDPDGRPVFEVFRKFEPVRPPMAMRGGHMMMHRNPWPERRRPSPGPEAERIIFVGLDMQPVDEAQAVDIRNALVMAAILLLIGFAGITLLFLAQEYRSARTRLSRVQAFSDHVVANMPIGLVALDDDGRVVAFNQVAERILARPADEVVGRPAEHVLPVDLQRALQQTDGRNGVIETEIDCRLADDGMVPLEVGAGLLADGSGNRAGQVLLLRDLTEVQALRREIARNQRLASVGRLAAGVAHEIRNPLSSIKGFATYFKDRYREVPEDQATAEIMVREVDRLNRVISQLLEFARPVRLRSEELRLDDFLKDSLKLIEKQAGEQRVEVRCEYRAAEKRVRLDPDRLRQVLLNLYLNALESMKDGGRLQVAAEASEEHRGVAIEVRDTGCGIPADQQANIFDPYYTTKTTGTGLGLAIVHNIVEAMAGQIRVESRPGKGTRFLVTLPGVAESEAT